MLKLFSHTNQRFLKENKKSELELNNFLKNNWVNIFPLYIIITNEFKLDGNVRSKGTSGRIDILAFNPKSNKFVVFELKKDQNKNVRDQASDYRDFIEDNFADVYLQTTQKYEIKLPKYQEISKESVEMVIIAQKFSQTDIDKAKKSNGEITLIRYFWFEGDLFLIDYLNNDPDDLLEALNTEKIKKIKAIIENKNVETASDVDMFFHKAEESKVLFNSFSQFLQNKFQNIKILVNKHTIRIFAGDNFTFSIVGFTGKSGKKTLLRIDTDLEISSIHDINWQDRMQINGKLKGSLSSERYQIFVCNEIELNAFLVFLENYKF